MTDSTRGFVYHVADDNPARILMATASARNAIAALGEDVRVDILAQGGAVRGATKQSAEADKLKAALAELPTVQVWLCSLAAQGNGITEDDLLDGVHLAATATAHAAQRQFEGWAYIRG
ncbi:MAG: DsrE family protein [Gulosibacter sp.]|uniref:DsrE family protein n=1 Tax=Gulosibacter sp. TaxID=2817531 RepID=UPI003F8F812A